MPRLRASPADIGKYTAVLVETPQRLATLTAGLADDQAGRAAAPQTWSAVEVLAHLRACADLWTYSIFAMLAADMPTLPEFDERRWARAAGYVRLPFSVSLQSFTLIRSELLAAPSGLPPESWLRSADIGGRSHTVFSQARRMALHEQGHWDQLEALVRALAAA